MLFKIRILYKKMALPEFSIIVAVDSMGGMGRSNEPFPGYSKDDTEWVRLITIGNRKNAIIMGRRTYEELPESARPLPDRHTFVISTTMNQRDHPQITVCSDLLDCLSMLGQQKDRYQEIFLLGGHRLYTTALENYMYLIRNIYLTQFKKNLNCDMAMPFLDVIKSLPVSRDKTATSEFTRFYFSTYNRDGTRAKPAIHDEYQYLKLVNKILDANEVHKNRTQVDTLNLWAPEALTFDLSTQRIPVITVMKVLPTDIVNYLLWVISGSTDTMKLEEVGIDWFRELTSKNAIGAKKLNYRQGDTGPCLGWNWRHAGAEYKGCEENYTNQGVDQLQNLIKLISDDPFSRRIYMSMWNPNNSSTNNNVVSMIPDCDVAIHFHVSPNARHLDCIVNIRSCDVFNWLPVEITMYSLLTHMIGHLTNKQPRTLTIRIDDAHIYLQHKNESAKLTARTPRPFPTFSFKNSHNISDITKFSASNFEFKGYTSLPRIPVHRVA